MEPVEIRSASGRKQALWFGAAERPLFGFYHPPAPGPWRGAGVVLCRPIGTDHTRSDRAYRHLAERLAQEGFACLRFDLSDTGDSADAAGPGFLSAWLDDLGLAARELRARSGAEAVCLVGLRLGGTLALLHAAERGGIDSLVLWSPWVAGAAYVAEVTKLHKLYLRIEPQLADAFPPRADGEEALGTLLPRALIAELSQVDLLKTAARPARRTLVIDGGNLAQRDPLVQRLTELGAAPELRSHPGHKFLITVSHRAAVPDEILGSIVEWLRGVYPGSAAQAEPPRLPALAGPQGERAVALGSEERPLFGIVTPADPSRARPGRPGILLLNAGCVNRAGPHRMTVRQARSWARLGFEVLRIDLSGIGDSPVEPGARENLTYPERGLDDLREALRGFGAQGAIVAGLCSGGDYAYQAGAALEGVKGVLILNPRTFCVLDLAAVESADGAPPSTPVAEVPRALRHMAARGVDTLLLVSHKDPGVAYVDAHAALAMQALAGLPRFKRIDIRADHTFTPVAAQDQVNDLLIRHLSDGY